MKKGLLLAAIAGVFLNLAAAPAVVQAATIDSSLTGTIHPQNDPPPWPTIIVNNSTALDHLSTTAGL